ncbi:MAG: hypothetical protein GY940_04940 [bacterium]|nr:hypothetical protein [bacterium]
MLHSPACSKNIDKTPRLSIVSKYATCTVKPISDVEIAIGAKCHVIRRPHATTPGGYEYIDKTPSFSVVTKNFPALEASNIKIPIGTKR